MISGASKYRRALGTFDARLIEASSREQASQHPGVFFVDLQALCQ